MNKKIFFIFSVVLLFLATAGCVKKEYNDASLQSFLREGPDHYISLPSQPNTYTPEMETSRFILALFEAHQYVLSLRDALLDEDYIKVTNAFVFTNKNVSISFKWKNSKDERNEMVILRVYPDGKDGHWEEHRIISVISYLSRGRIQQGIFTTYRDSNGSWYVRKVNHLVSFKH